MFILMTNYYFHSLALSSRAIVSVSGFICTASVNDSSCERLVALAIGAATAGFANNQDRDMAAGEVLYFSAALSRAERIRNPLSFKYFFTPSPLALFERSLSERYLPLKNPLASE